MALVLKDRVKETATANTTVSFTLGGAIAGFQSFSVVGNTNTTYYAATDTNGNWEAGLGTYSTTGPTLTRTTILSSSNSGSAVTFSGTITVFLTYPSSRSIYLDGTSAGINVSQAAFTANGIPYASSTSALSTGSTLSYTSTGLGINQSTPAARIQIGTTALSSAAWTTSGVGLRIDSATYTSTGTLSGTVASHSIARPTLAATSASTVTIGTTLYIAGGPIKGTGVSTLTDGYALYIATDTNASLTTVKQTNNVFIGGKLFVTADNAYDTAWSNIRIDANCRNDAETFSDANRGVALNLAGGTYINNSVVGGTYFNSVVLNQVSLSDNNGGGLVITNAATLKIVGSPYTFDGGSITNAWSLYITNGRTYLGGRTTIAPNGSGIGSNGTAGTDGFGLRVDAGLLYYDNGLSVSLASANSIAQPSFASTTTGSNTITNAATFYIANSPSATQNGGATLTITNAYSLYVASGKSFFGGNFVGDFSNATLSNRAAFQSSTVNGTTAILAIPNGTNTDSSFQTFNSSDTTNAIRTTISTSATEGSIQVSRVGSTATYLPLTFYTSGLGRFVIGTSGQFGIGPLGSVTYGTSGQLFTSGGASAAPTWTSTTGSGNVVLATSPTLVTPVLGTPSSGTLSSCTVDGTDSVGFRNVPINSKSAAYTTVLSDSGKVIFHPSTDANARTFTIDSNANVAYALGTVLTFINMTSQIVTIAITSDTMYLTGTGSTGSRSLAQYGMATAIKMTSTTWIISGSGLS